MTLKSIEKLRAAGRNMAKGSNLENHEECNLLLIIADEIEREIAAWNSRAERTCHIEYPFYGDAPVINGQPRCSECKTEFAVGAFSNYCPNCGARVMGND